MTTSLPHSQITDELLSAYIDGNVSESERSLIESATQRDREVAWRLETLRQTVQLLRALPQIALPRSFSVEAVLASERGTTQAPPPVTRRTAVQQAEQPSWWQSFLDFWRSGSPMLRNAAVGAMALFLVLGLGNQSLLVSNQITAPPAFQSVSKEQAARPMAVEADAAAPSQQSAPAESTEIVETVASLAADATPGEEASTALFDTQGAEAQATIQAAAAISAGAPLVAPLSEVTANEAVVAAAVASTEDEPQIAMASAPSRESAPGVSAKAVGGAPDGAVGGGAEDVTAFDTAMREAVDAAPESMGMAPGGESAAAPSGGGEESAVARAPAAAVALPVTAAATDSPTPLPTSTTVPTRPPATSTTAPIVDQAPMDADQQLQDSTRARLTPPYSEGAAESSSLSSVRWLVQWGAAVLAPVFFVLWLRSRRVDSKS